MRRHTIPVVLATALLAGCTAHHKPTRASLADLQIEKQFGIHAGDLKPRQMAAPKPGEASANPAAHTPDSVSAVAGAGRRESDREFERRTTAETPIIASSDVSASL